MARITRVYDEAETIAQIAEFIAVHGVTRISDPYGSGLAFDWAALVRSGRDTGALRRRVDAVACGERVAA